MLPVLAVITPRRTGLTAPLRRLLAVAGTVTRRRARTLVLLLMLLVVVGAGGGLYLYALHQWQSAQAEEKAGRLDQAQRRLDFCLTLWPRSIPVHLLAARVARRRGDFEGAETHLNRCLKLNHGASPEIQLEFLLMRAQEGEEGEAVSELFGLYVDQGSPETPVILETLALMYLRNLRFGPAYACLSRWVAAAPDSAEPLRWRGWVLEKLHARDEAIKDYQRALELDPNLVSVRLRLAELYLERKDPLPALPHLEQLHQQFPDRPDIMARLGECRFLQGETEEARRLLQAAVEQLPDDSDILVYLSKLATQANEPAEAERWLRRALELDSTNAEVEYLLYGSLQAQGRLEEAAAMLKRHDKDRAMLNRITEVLRRDADHPVTDPAALTEVGTVLLRPNERAGRYWLHRALERDPDYQPALKALAEHYESKGELDKAAQYRRRMKPESKAPGPGQQP